MTLALPAAATPAARRPATPGSAATSERIVVAARLLLPDLEQGRAIDARALRAAMARAFGGSDADGAWDWKTAYDAGEAATVLFLRKFGPAMRARAASPAAMAPMLAKIAGLLPTQTRRSEESQALQQFSTPIALGLAAGAAAAITAADLVLEPSAGTGLLAILAELAGGALMLNELANTRAGLLDHLFPGVVVTRFDAAQIDDHLDAGAQPSVVLMNPPFSVMAQVDGRVADAAFRHIRSALARLADGGRLVAITGASVAPENHAWTDAFVRLQASGRLVFSAAIDGAGRLTDALYEAYRLQAIRIPGAQAHPTALVQSAAMASVAPPKPRYRPHLPPNLVAAGLLSDAQLESVIYAGEAHSDYLAGAWTVDATFDVVSAAPDDAEDAVCFRRGWFLGDGTGAGKGRQAAGILLDNWLKGRRRALWVSKSDKLLEDAQRDWSALGMERLLVTPLSRFRQGAPIRLSEGVLFTTYATLRSEARGEALSRVQQIVQWLGADFDGVIIFDESHAMQNAGGAQSERGDQAASQQGRAGLRLQHALPNARVVYVSATGATTVHNLAYAQRLGLWGGEDFPFATRAEFVEAIEAGGVAAMEVLARDLKALGLYAARSLSYAGVEYELVEHELTREQIRLLAALCPIFQPPELLS